MVSIEQVTIDMKKKLYKQLLNIKEVLGIVHLEYYYETFSNLFEMNDN